MSADESSAMGGALQLTELGSLVASVADHAYSGLRGILEGDDGPEDDEQRFVFTVHGDQPCI